MSILKPNHSDVDFMGELDAAVNMRPATPAILMLFAIVGLIIFLFIWASFAEIEELTRGQGQVVPTKEVQVIQSLEGGVVQDILVKEGQAVKAGQIVLRISDVLFASQERGAEAKFMGLRAQRSRLRAEIDGKDFTVDPEIEEKYPQIVANERALYRSRQNELRGSYNVLNDRISKASAEIAEANAQVARLGDSITSLQEELTITKQLVKSRAMPKLEEIRLQREYNDIQGQINAERERARALEAERRVAQSEKANISDRFRSEALTELSNVETQIAELQENLTSISDRVDRAEIRSPVDGVVNRIAINTVGGVIEPAQALMEIVPLGDELKIIAEVGPDQIAFLRAGQPAKVKLSAYDPQKYGALEGTLTRVGANSIAGKDGNIFFEIEVQTEKNYLGTEEKPLPIMPGMVATVEVITGKRTILYYLLKPLMRAKSQALTER